MSQSYFSLNARWFWVIAALLGLLLLGRPSHAQITTLAGGTLTNTGVLATTGTFQNAGTFVPTAGTLTVTNGDFLNTGTITSAATTGTVALVDASAAHTLALAGQSLPTLTLNVPAGTTLTNSGGITTALTFAAGVLKTSNANTLTLASAATVNGESNTAYVVGHLAQSQALSGNSAIDFGKVGVTVNPAGQSFALAVDRRAGLNLSNVSFGQNPVVAGNKSIDRVWAFTGGTTATPATVVLSWLSANDNGLAFAGTNAQVWRSDNNGTSWVRQNAAADGTARSMTITTTALNALYTVSTTAAPLPVELAAFTARKVANDGQLSWLTASEKNAAFMEVQASATGADWAVLGQVAAAGSSSSPRPYAFLDRNLGRYRAARVYYRLRLVDRDGTAAYSPLVSLVPDAGALAFALSAWPNPFGAGALAVELATPQAGDLSLVVYDAVGRLVLQRTFRALAAGTQALRLDAAAELPAGSYTLVARQGGQRAAVHLVRQ